jgi:tetratricopeptide (TPR) repeat protein
MIELMLQAERALSMGMVDRAEQLYWQAIETDSRNSIAIVGLAKIATERGDEGTALLFARKALEIDPDNGAAQRILKRLEESAAERGLPPAPPPPEVVAAVEAVVPTEAAAEQPADGESPAADGFDEDAPLAQPPAPKRARPDVEWPAADLEQARQGTLPPVPPNAGNAAPGPANAATPDWPGADTAGRPASDDKSGRGKDPA